MIATLREKSSMARVVKMTVKSGIRNMSAGTRGALTLGITISRNGNSNTIGPAINARNPLPSAERIPSSSRNVSYKRKSADC